MDIFKRTQSSGTPLIEAQIGALTLETFKREDFEVDALIVSLLPENQGSEEEWDAGNMLKALKGRCEEVERLRKEAEKKGRLAREEAARLGREHRECVGIVRGEAEQALVEVQLLEERVSAVGSKAVTIGQRIDKVDRQRRRAYEARQAIAIYNDLRSDDKNTRSAAIASLLPNTDSSSAADDSVEDVDRERGRGENNMMAGAAMLRKIDGMVRVLNVEGAQRAKDSMAVVKEKFEQVLLERFDDAKLHWDEDQGEASLAGMQKCASSLFSFNGGASCIQRYVSTLSFCIDASVMMRDDEGILESTNPDVAKSEIERVLTEVSDLFEREKTSTQLIFPSCSGRVLAQVVQRALNQRVQKTIDGCLESLEEACGSGAWSDVVQYAYGRLHSMLNNLAASETDLEDLDLGKLLDDVLGDYRIRFITHSFQTLASLLSTFLPPPSPSDTHSSHPSFSIRTAHPEKSSGASLLTALERMTQIDKSSEIATKCVEGLIVCTRSIPPGPLDGSPEVLKTFGVLISSLSSFLTQHMSDARNACGRGQEGVEERAASELKVAVHAVMVAQRFAEEIVTPVTRHDVQLAQECTTLMWEFSVTVEQRSGELLRALVSAVGRCLSSLLSSTQHKSDFMPKTDDCALEPSQACLAGSGYINSIRKAWSDEGPPSLGGGGGDGNTRILLNEIAKAACGAVTEHIRQFQYSPVGGLQLMRDLQAWKHVAVQLGSRDTERHFEEYKEASNVLVIPPTDLQDFLEDGAFYKSPACSDLLELRCSRLHALLDEENHAAHDIMLCESRSDWKTVRDKLSGAFTGGKGGGGRGGGGEVRGRN